MSSDTADAPSLEPDPFLITFSGIDGAGKTTQIEYLSTYLQGQGLRVLRLAFWDHVAIWPRVRAGVGERAVNLYPVDQVTAYSFSPKNHKHIRNWYLTAARSGLYLLDVVRLRGLLANPRMKNFDVVIFDRYIYDQIANVYSRSRTARVYSQIVLEQTPRPDLAFILDTSPDAAFARKPEYPLEFMHQNRQNFLRLRELAPELIVISDARPEDVRNEIERHIGRSRLQKFASIVKKFECECGNTVVPANNSLRVQNQPTASD
jgi:thymidylate kinase